MRKMINVIGLGYIGLPTALMMASHGVEVIGTDYNKELVATLNAGHTTFKEDGLDEYNLEARAENTKICVNYVFEYYSDGHIRRIYNPHNNQEIVCREGGEITFRVYEMEGLSTSMLIGNDALNVEFSVREPKSAGTWMETLFLGYNRIAYMVYKNNRIDSFEAFSPENGNNLAQLDCVEKGDTLVYTWVKSNKNSQKRTYVRGNLIKDETISQWGTILTSLSYDECDGNNDISLEKLREYLVNNI